MLDIFISWTDPVTGQHKQVVSQPPLTIGRAADNTVVLSDTHISRQHAVIHSEGRQVVVIDRGSKAGVYVDGRRQERGVIAHGSKLRIGPFLLDVALHDVADPPSSNETTSGATDSSDATRAAQPPGEHTVTREPSPSVVADMEWPPAVFAQQQVPMQALLQLGVSISTCDYATIGAGLGSFVWVNLLRISGVKPEQIVALGLHPKPYAHYQYLTRNSQIPDHERLRSNSESTPDNMWGWPGYGLREIWHDLRRGQPGRACATFWQIFGEPTLTDTYTPRIGDVFQALDREAQRIGWGEVLREGRVRAIRKTDDGRYVVAFSQQGTAETGGRPTHGLLIARYLHIAIGYPSIQFLPDLQRYREATGDFKAVVNAYEDHDHIYEHLRKHGGLVMVRGRGIVASRIIQRIAEERRFNPAIGIVHLLRSPIARGHAYGRSRRMLLHHIELQPFNWPRGCWTGPQRKQLERADPQQRKELLALWGGTTTARRKDWTTIIEQGLREGWYQVVFGKVERIERAGDDQLVTIVKTTGQVEGQFQYATNFVIDATGLDGNVRSNALLRDMIEHYSLPLNVLERLQVENDFEVTKMRNGKGRMYAAGAMTLGGPNAGVDTFLGLQYAAYRSIDTLTQLRAPGLHYLNGLRSVYQWLKWARGVRP